MHVTRHINQAIRKLTAIEPAPVIRWSDVDKIDALGTDALGGFEIMLTFHYADGTSDHLFAHHYGYNDILESLAVRYPNIPADWYEQMSAQPWHVERCLYGSVKSASL